MPPDPRGPRMSPEDAHGLAFCKVAENPRFPRTAPDKAGRPAPVTRLPPVSST